MDSLTIVTALTIGAALVTARLFYLDAQTERRRTERLRRRVSELTAQRDRAIAHAEDAQALFEAIAIDDAIDSVKRRHHAKGGASLHSITGGAR